MHGGTSLAGSGTTHTCVKSVGTFDSQKDYCYTCGSREKGTLGYCWNSQTPQCPPACNNLQGVSGIGDNQCGGPCDKFIQYGPPQPAEDQQNQAYNGPGAFYE